ncbi:MAG TPA: sugar phosphate nucleotidyltransferase [Acidimicrobiales bacterium]|nr:sugar phosphate nucleotidyltransferase [Acidimicrobiales bacterium]
MSVRTVILCGGKGTRAYPQTATVPKPLLEVAGQPVVRQVMEIYAAHGFTDFVLAAGYKKEMLQDFADKLEAPWTVDVVDTGEETNTGGRVRAVADVVGDTFFVTYSDGLGDVDLAQTLEYHRSHDGFATMTTVPLPSQYGTVDFDDSGRVQGFKEKPKLPDHYINAGFFVMDRRCFDAWPTPGEDLERDVMPAFARAGGLFVYKHHGFWKSMDTYKDALDLTALCDAGVRPWMQL